MPDKGTKEYHFIDSLHNPSSGENAYALLYEIVDCLQALLTDGQPSRIDLSAIPMSDADLELLQENLGEGPIMAEVMEEDEDGVLRISETGIPGVWWLQELDDEDLVQSEYIEINNIPEALQIDTVLISDGRDALQARLFQLGLGRRPSSPPSPSSTGS
jgi:hydrogenase-1 operon protein HyaF